MLNQITEVCPYCGNFMMPVYRIHPDVVIRGFDCDECDYHRNVEWIGENIEWSGDYD